MAGQSGSQPLTGGDRAAIAHHDGALLASEFFGGFEDLEHGASAGRGIGIGDRPVSAAARTGH